MVSEIIKIVASKYKGESANTATIFDLATATTATLQITIPEGWVYYLLAYGGNVQNTDEEISINDKNGNIIEQYSEFPDSFVRFDYPTPLTTAFKGSMSVRFTNSSGATDTITFFVEGLIIPLKNQIAFEEEVLGFPSFSRLLNEKAQKVI